ncbi:hypothetical protein GCM10010413_37630 [Promicromonospora sukumoe]|uniref:Uncharacterized protein n=1 Tax=Promicromonospora sukumoe TaxID=88382 RepID=A0A7W3PDF9_9MICO|nr:hypothetical protein [Promicromonospora sukumoe]MBA8807701.1 hypothetical protein [Promicromonospora sukumoe]
MYFVMRRGRWAGSSVLALSIGAPSPRANNAGRSALRFSQRGGRGVYPGVMQARVIGGRRRITYARASKPSMRSQQPAASGDVKQQYSMNDHPTRQSRHCRERRFGDAAGDARLLR